MEDLLLSADGDISLYHVKKEASTKPGQDCRFMYILMEKGCFLIFV